MRKLTSIIIAGGSGHWAELNHYSAILEIKKKNRNIKVAAIVDINDPKKQKSYKNLQKILEIDSPEWINPENFSEQELESKLNDLAQKKNVRMIFVATNPFAHYFYNSWGAKNNINVLCDKPLVIYKNAASDINSAKEIQRKYEKLAELINENKKINPRYLFSLPLRRRVLNPFLQAAKDLKSISEITNEGIRNMHVIINGGVHKFPNEFIKGGAHGYLDGIGALSHSSYHYIDVIAWYLSIAKGDIYKISINLPYILRVKDYLEINGYSKLRELIEEDGSEAFNDPNKIPIQVLAAELDFTFHLNLFNKNNQLLGLVTYTSSHTTFTPRLTKYHKDMIEYTNDKLGGRMSQVYFDIHQGAMQNIQIIKNDVVFEENKILTYTRKHPLLGKPLVIKKYRNAYDRGTATPKDLVNAFIKYTNGQDVNHDHLSAIKNFDNQRLTNKLFSLFYELIAQNYQNKGRNKKIKIDNEIILGDYL